MNEDSPIIQEEEWEFDVTFRGACHSAMRIGADYPPIVEVRDANGKLLRRIKATSIEQHTSEDGTLMSVSVQGEELSLGDEPKETDAQ